MKDKWRIPLTILTTGAFILGGWIVGWLMIIPFYLFVGFLMWVIIGFEAPKIIILWLPALWSAKVVNLL